MDKLIVRISLSLSISVYLSHLSNVHCIAVGCISENKPLSRHGDYYDYEWIERICSSKWTEEDAKEWLEPNIRRMQYSTSFTMPLIINHHMILINFELNFCQLIFSF